MFARTVLYVSSGLALEIFITYFFIISHHYNIFLDSCLHTVLYIFLDSFLHIYNIYFMPLLFAFPYIYFIMLALFLFSLYIPIYPF